MNAVLDEKICFCKIAHHLDPEIRKMLANYKFWNEESVLVYNLLAIEVKILFLKLTM